MSKPSFNAAVDTRVRNVKSSQQSNQQPTGTTVVPTQKVDGRKTRGGYVSQETMDILNTVINVLSTKYMNKEFTIRGLCEDLPKSITSAWRAPDLELNRIIQRVLQIKPNGIHTHAATRGKPANTFLFTGEGCYTPKKLFGTGPTSVVPGGKRQAKKDREQAAGTAPMGALDTGKQTRPYNRRNPVQQAQAQPAPVATTTTTALDTPAQQPSNIVPIGTAGAAKHFDEVVEVNGVRYELGGDSHLVRRTGNDPVAKKFTALVFDLKTSAPLLVNGDIVRLPKKAKK